MNKVKVNKELILTFAVGFIFFVYGLNVSVVVRMIMGLLGLFLFTMHLVEGEK
jgi:hypothetical protein